MPDFAHRSQQVVLSRIGAGQVITDLPPQDLIDQKQARILDPASPRALNLRLLDNVAGRRPGYALLGTSPNALQITGLFHAVFDDGSVVLARATKSSIHTYASGGYTDRSSGVTFTNNNDSDYWAFAMVPRIGSVTPKLWLMASDMNNYLKIWEPSESDFLDVTAANGYTNSPKGAVAIASFLSRCWIANVLDDAGERKNVRIINSVVGDSTDWTGAGVVETDLLADPYPIKQLAVMAGGLIIFKGDQFGGSITRGTPTGLLNTPLRYDAMNPGSGVGLLLRRSLIVLSEGLAFFVGHDGLYLYDGVRGAKRVAEGITRQLLRDLNYDALDAAFAEYKPRTEEIIVHIPTGTSSTPNITWVYNKRDNRAYGPYEYGQVLTSSSKFTISGTYEWYDDDLSGADDLDYPSGWGTLPWESWNEIGGATGASSIAYGADDGAIYNDTDSQDDSDNGTTIVTAYDTACVVADERSFLSSQGQPVQLGPYDMLTLEDVGIEYESSSDFSPSVSYSLDDGNNWNPISNSEVLPAGTGEQQWYSWSPQITGKRFMVRVGDDSTDFKLHAVHLRVSYAGDRRNG